MYNMYFHIFLFKTSKDSTCTLYSVHIQYTYSVHIHVIKSECTECYSIREDKNYFPNQKVSIYPLIGFVTGRVPLTNRF